MMTHGDHIELPQCCSAYPSPKPSQSKRSLSISEPVHVCYKPNPSHPP